MFQLSGIPIVWRASSIVQGRRQGMMSSINSATGLGFQLRNYALNPKPIKAQSFRHKLQKCFRDVRVQGSGLRVAMLSLKAKLEFRRNLKHQESESRLTQNTEKSPLPKPQGDLDLHPNPKSCLNAKLSIPKLKPSTPPPPKDP